MRHDVQVQLIKQLLAHLDAGTNVDAGGLRLQSTSTFTDPAQAERERELFFLGTPQCIGLSQDLAEPGDFLTVFASNQPVPNYVDAGGFLHTDFGLDATGEYVAVVDPFLNVLSEYGPAGANYPQQHSDFSYGAPFDAVDLILTGFIADYLVPTDNSLGTTWTQPGFDASAWASGPTGLGYGQLLPGFVVRDVQSATTLNNVNDAEAVIGLPAGAPGIISETTEIHPIINFLDTGADGHYGLNAGFPNDQFADYNDFAIQAQGTVTIPTAGTWTFGTNSDDGLRLRVDGSVVIDDPNPHGPADRFGQVVLAAGQHSIDLVYFERGGGAELELFAAQGSFNSFDQNAFDLVGDVANGGLEVGAELSLSGTSLVHRYSFNNAGGTQATDRTRALAGDHRVYVAYVVFDLAGQGSDHGSRSATIELA